MLGLCKVGSGAWARVCVRSAPVQVFIKWWDVKYSFGAYLPQSGENVYIRVWLTGKGLYFLHH